VRFSLDRPGPPGFAVRGWGRPLSVPPNYPGSFPRCTLLPVPAEDPDPSPRPPEAVPAGIGDVDGRRSGYNDDGCMVHGDVQVRPPGHDGVLTADVRMNWTGTQDGDLAFDAAPFRLALDPVSDAQSLRVLRKGETADPHARVWDKYLALVRELTLPRYRPLPLEAARDYRPDPNRVTVFLRRDMDLTVYGSLQMAEYEARAGLRVSYLVNLASTIYSIQARNGRYWVSPSGLETLARLRELGHEVGWQNDVVAQRIEFNTPPGAWVAHELGRLRRAGLPITTVAANGSPHVDTHLTRNFYLFADCRLGGRFHADYAGRTNGETGEVTVDRGGRKACYPLPDLTFEQAGFTVSANHLPHYLKISPDQYQYFSDVTDDLDSLLARLRAAPVGSVMQLMTHDNRSTTHSQGLDLTVDPAFEKYYVNELRETVNP
ncbi:MAG: hypothetical protein J2P46_09760, partial [Zavarzinella sp.]|nr:hypothetical protein [Zavarzinella sp.]